MAAACEAGLDFVAPVRPDTIAKSLAIGNPADGVFALDVARSTGGAISAVTEEEIVEGIELLARTTGIFTETAGGVTTAVARQARRAPAASTPTSASSSTSPATASRPSTPWRRASSATPSSPPSRASRPRSARPA